MDHPGEVTKLWRKSRKMSIPLLARKSKIDKGTISRFERGGDFRKRIFEAICAALDHTPKDVYAVLSEEQRFAHAETSICPDNNPDHIFYQKLLEEVLHGDQIIAKLAIVGLEALVARSRDGPSDKSDKLSRMKLAGNQ